jgi:hypothetical protein
MYYDASKEHKPFANRGKGGALTEDAFPQHPRTRTNKRASSRGKPRGTPNVRVREITRGGGQVWTRLRDGVVISKGQS